jgi:hypothetical protein
MAFFNRKVWKYVASDILCLKTVAEHEAEFAKDASLTDTANQKIRKEVDEWDEKDKEALWTIFFTVSDKLQGPVYTGKTSLGAWDELQRVHTSNDRQWKFSFLRRLYQFQMSDTTIVNYERTFDDLVQSLADIGNTFDADELIIRYTTSLLN